MDVSTVARYSGLPTMPPAGPPAGSTGPASGLSKQDQLAVLGARPAVLHLAATAAADAGPADPASTGSASGQGSVDMYV